MKTVFNVTLLFILLNLSFVLAGTTGKISGRVTDITTGDPLIGSNIIIKGTQMGAACDLEGYYFILNVPPGEYSLSVMMMGYETQVKTGVKVSADRTTSLDFAIHEKALEVGEVVVVAERPLIQKDVTAKSVIVESEVFSEMPVSRFQEVLTTQAGFTTDEEGEIHVRGGRTGEVAYMIDGVYVRDPYSGGFGSQLDKYTIEELQVLTGAYSAEYGQAMSGVINIVTKEGNDNYHGRLEYETLRLNESPYRKADWMLDSDIVEGLSATEKIEYQDNVRDSLDASKYLPPKYDQKGTPQYIPLNGSLIGNFSGPVPYVRNLTFFVSGSYSNDKGFYPWGYDKRREVNAKTTYRINPLKVNFFIQRNYRKWKPYSHRWKYNPDGYEDRQSDVAREGVIITHTLSPSTFYEARFSRFERKYDRFLAGKWANFSFDESTGKSEFLDSNFERRRSNSDGFYFEGDNGTIDDRNILTYTGRVDLTSQFNRMNLLKAGAEFVHHRINRETFIQPWTGENHRYEKFTRTPVEFAFYVQDKLEHEHFIINMGFRYDYSDPKHSMWPSLDIPGTIVDGEWVASEEVPVNPKTQLSPRIGIGFPVTEKTMFYSSYGHFYQVPNYLEMYGPHKVDEDQPLIGNPAIEPQKTVAFEAGLKQQIAVDWALDFNIYFKDITNLAGSTYHGFFPFEYTLYDNSDYASVNGIDVSLTKRYSNYFSANVNYSYSVAKGNESDPREGYTDYKRSNFPLRPKRLFYLDFDRRHDFACNLNLISPRNFGPSVWNSHPLADFQFNILFEASSGLPYTPRVEDAGESILVVKNSAHQPSVFNLDVKVLKKIRFGSADLTAFVVINNVFDRRNALNVWTRTGLPWDGGPYTSNSFDRIHNPSNVSEPRRWSIGARLEF